tara:strand:- start:203 stop:379 length:177 start_codon:yes stop_codon:yes gene_type:complete
LPARYVDITADLLATKAAQVAVVIALRRVTQSALITITPEVLGESAVTLNTCYTGNTA